MKVIQYLSLFLILGSSFSCKKENKQENSTDLLTRASWALLKEEYNDHGVWKEWDETLYDELLFVFRKDGVLKIENTIHPKIWYGEWKFTEEGNVIWTKANLLPKWTVFLLTKNMLQVIEPPYHTGEPEVRCTFVHP